MKDFSDIKRLINEMFEEQIYKDTILLELHTHDIFPNDPNFVNKDRELIVDSSTKHPGRIKISTINGNTRSGKTCSIYIDNEKKNGGEIKYDGKPKDIKLDKMEIAAYEALCRRNWDLMCHIYIKHIDAKTARDAFEYDERLRREGKNIVRDRQTGYGTYITIEGYEKYRITVDINCNIINKERVR